VEGGFAYRVRCNECGVEAGGEHREAISWGGSRASGSRPTRSSKWREAAPRLVYDFDPSVVRIQFAACSIGVLQVFSTAVL